MCQPRRRRPLGECWSCQRRGLPSRPLRQRSGTWTSRSSRRLRQRCRSPPARPQGRRSKRPRAVPVSVAVPPGCKRRRRRHRRRRRWRRRREWCRRSSHLRSRQPLVLLWECQPSRRRRPCRRALSPPRRRHRRQQRPWPRRLWPSPRRRRRCCRCRPWAPPRLTPRRCARRRRRGPRPELVSAASFQSPAHHARHLRQPCPLRVRGVVWREWR
mmetsp:Transcript_726/g.2784  ORF Transcript_726/g.2784 Transcript_726/m.2784 type:complete len:214 (-) Transcript_726:1007-1648(-)